MGVISWVLVFFEVSILMFGFNIKSTDKSIIHYILFPIAIFIPTLIYFKKPNLKTGAQQGLYLGIIFFLVSLLLDTLITIPLFVNDFSFLLNPYHLIGLAESLVVTVIVAETKRLHELS